MSKKETRPSNPRNNKDSKFFNYTQMYSSAHNGRCWTSVLFMYIQPFTVLIIFTNMSVLEGLYV